MAVGTTALHRRHLFMNADSLRTLDRRIGERRDDAVWIHRPPLDELLASAPTDASLPLFGQTFAVKDNIDVAGWPTTAGCPEFSYVPDADAPVVARLRALGAIPVGKTNLDQFATGLVGTRSPFGIPRSVFSDAHIAGGSSSGSAVAVAAGLVAFALGTDTAGSGRVPAAFNNIVGLKPTRGVLSTRGVVPACRSLDCVSIFARSVAEAHRVFAASREFDAGDPFSRVWKPESRELRRIGVPRAGQLEFFGDDGMRALYEQAQRRFEIAEIDYSPFRDAARLLYAGPWVAERTAAVGEFLAANPDAGHPVVRQIVMGGAKHSAVESFRASYELARLRRLADAEWTKMDAMLLPTTPTIYTVEEVLADPIRLNSNLGTYTNFVNLLDLCALAVPAGFRPDGLPLGVTLIAPAFHDDALAQLGAAFLREEALHLAATGVDLSVVGAHLSGQPLNRQLTSRGAQLVKTCRTASDYRLYALANTTPPKPGLVRAPGFAGPGIETEVWRMSFEAFGEFVAEVPAPMGIGSVVLEDGATVKGFLCEVAAIDGAREITEFGGWRAFRAAQ
ncbi:MAG: allophanate hydrolase [Chthoniobacteraceae bacterium]